MPTPRLCVCECVKELRISVGFVSMQSFSLLSLHLPFLPFLVHGNLKWLALVSAHCSILILNVEFIKVDDKLWKKSIFNSNAALFFLSLSLVKAFLVALYQYFFARPVPAPHPPHECFIGFGIYTCFAPLQYLLYLAVQLAITMYV